MAEFEDACKDLNLELFVLPPAKPQYNGVVERGNRTFREEFYNLPTLLEDSAHSIKRFSTKLCINTTPIDHIKT